MFYPSLRLSLSALSCRSLTANDRAVVQHGLRRFKCKLRSTTLVTEPVGYALGRLWLALLPYETIHYSDLTSDEITR